jgi:hypothetical protein
MYCVCVCFSFCCFNLFQYATLVSQLAQVKPGAAKEYQHAVEWAARKYALAQEPQGADV